MPFGYNILVAFWGAHSPAEKIRYEVVPGGVLGTQARVFKMNELNYMALVATPAYVLGMGDTARRKLGSDVAQELSIRITRAGKPGACIPTTKNRIEEERSVKIYDHIGATESGAWRHE